MEVAMIWSLRKPVLWAWRKLLGMMGAWTIVPIFQQAHNYHTELRRWQKRWVELVEGVEYQLHTRSSLDADASTEQWVWIRNTGKVVIDEIHFCVEAKLGSASYQVPLTSYRLQPACRTRLALVGLPLQDLIVHENSIFQTYESVHVYPARVVRNEQLEVYATGGVGWHPSYDNYLNGEWSRWDGRLYNLKAISDSRRDNLFRLAHSLCGRYDLFSLDLEVLLKQVLRSGRYRRLPGVLIFGLVSWTPILNAILWTRLLLRVERIAFECDPATVAATEHVLNKGAGARPIRVVNINAKSSIS